ncbi:MAG: superoxide dismutase family protein [Minicystis sp.]
MPRASLIASLFPLLLAACGGTPAADPVTPPAGTSAPADSAAAAASGAPVASAMPAASGTPAVAPVAAPSSVEVTIEARSSSKLKGTATFTGVADGVKVSIKVSGAPPGKVATHVHETGDCSAPDGKSAGGHFNPGAHAHGLPEGERHLGDLGNIDIAADGTGTLEITVKGANLKPGDATSYLGRAIIVHEKKDDGGQPTGNAGGRIGCGVIAVKK